MSGEVFSPSIYLDPCENRPQDDVEFPGTLRPTRAGRGLIRILVVGTYDPEGRLAPPSPDDLPYLEIDLTSGRARDLAAVLAAEADAADGYTSMAAPKESHGSGN